MTQETKIIIVCGSGGVGKTTVSASLGLRLALEGKRVAVLTIDPAKRLATSLGLKTLQNKPQKIALENSDGELWAMMLDTKSTFDHLIEKYAPDEDAKKRILNNKLYKHMSGMLAGTQEYMAMEKLYDIWQMHKYEAIIIDTPPVQNALDFLSAPQRMTNMIENSMLHLLLKPTLSVGKSSFKLFEKGSQQILKIFDRITGFAFLQDLSEMLIAFKELLVGFEQRSRQVFELMGHEETSFVTVNTCDERSRDECLAFKNQLEKMSFRLSRVIVNRVHSGSILSDQKLNETAKLLAESETPQVSEALVNNYKRFRPLIKRDANQIKAFKEDLTGVPLSQIPLFLTDVHDVAGLVQISEHLPKF